jgi:hypothetical protein
METVKKNMLSIICGVVAIAAVVAWFWPVGPMYDHLKSDLSARAKTYQDVDSLRTASRKLPALVLDGGEQPSLDHLPNEKVINAGKQATQKLTEQSKRMLETVSKLNVHTPLVPGTLPIAGSTARGQFPAAYFEALGATDRGFETGLPKKLNATRPPFADELMEMANKIWDDKYNPRVVAIGNDNNLDSLRDEFLEEIRNLPDQERNKRADTHTVYLDETSLPLSQEIQGLNGKPPTDVQIWFAQMALWVTEDVVNAVNAANKDSKRIPDSPIKHLKALRIPFGIGQYVLQAQAVGGAPDAAGVTQDPNGVPQAFVLSPTGRVSNDVYDVLHFDLVLRVDFRKLPQIIAELERNRLFTVMSTAVTTVDAQAEFNDVGYVYGNDPIAEVTLQCEALYLRSWTVDKENTYKRALMPQLVRGWVGAEAVAGLPGAPQGGAAGGTEYSPEESPPQ